MIGICPNSFVKEERNGICIQIDTWQVAKSVEKEISAVCKGPKSKHGITWHRELSKFGVYEPTCSML